MSLFLQAEVALELLLAAFLGMVIGVDREGRGAPAGMRTHMLVSVGACLFTTLSFHAFPGGDPGRVAAQIVTGIGFLGAGTILQRDGGIRHLTTAASIWATAAVGMAVGVGAWFLALSATLIIWVILDIVRRFEAKRKASTAGSPPYSP
ncbi:MAG: MgtC/SapB family protein [Anaerolineaceae bacterium]|nr:MgtC/SapB family protein [Anaerolineaceae bacterium]